VTRVAIDTNVLAYAEGVNGEQNRTAALNLLRRMPADGTILPAQTLSELFNVLTRKAGRDPGAAREAVLAWQDAFDVADTSGAVVLDALELAMDRQLGIWDAIILATAARAGCRLLLSEDMQDGFTWRGVTVTNPFSGQPHPLLAALLAAGPEPG
jgi:predicted nucleic acid-binding protein